MQNKRISWDELWMTFAHSVKLRSPDQQTKCGAVIVRDNIILSVGYNGFIRGIEKDFPAVRPEKYKWVIHAEINAILNAAYNGVSCKDATIYITGLPCISCALAVVQSGITEIVIPETTRVYNDIHMLNNDEYKAWWEQFQLIISDRVRLRYLSVE